MIQLNLKSGVPICDQIVNGMIRLKALGILQKDEQLPSVRAMAIKLSVNPNTVQKAYEQLEMHGIIYSVKGKGSFISDDSKAQKAIMKSAENDFLKAVKSAKELGLSQERLADILDSVFKPIKEDEA